MLILPIMEIGRLDHLFISSETDVTIGVEFATTVSSNLGTIWTPRYEKLCTNLKWWTCTVQVD